jgi:hypothetical protein
VGGILGAKNSWFWGSMELEATNIMVFERERERVPKT